jgi:hypothetical protein
MERFHYVYRLEDKTTGEFYIGVRTTPKGITIENDKYMGSMKKWKPNKSNLNKIILAIFDDVDKARWFEINMISALITHELNRNYHIPRIGFGMWGTGLNTEEFISKANDVHNGKYSYDKVHYDGIRTPVMIYCHIHNEYFNQKPISHLNGKGCQKCNGGIKYNTEEFISKANDVHNRKYIYKNLNYKNSRTKIIIPCTVCIKDFKQEPVSHLSGHGCPNCNNCLKLDNVEFIKKATKIHKGIYTYKNLDYKNSHTKIIITCTICSENFEQKPYTHLNGSGCPNCKVTKHITKGKGYVYDKIRNRYNICTTFNKKNKKRTVFIITTETEQEAIPIANKVKELRINNTITSDMTNEEIRTIIRNNL